MDSVANVLGIVGCVLILFGFYRTSIGQWTGKTLWFELDNFLGAAFLIIYSLDKKAYVNIALNVVWAAVALKGISSIEQRRAGKGRRKA
jgi:hypothetical protein